MICFLYLWLSPAESLRKAPHFWWQFFEGLCPPSQDLSQFSAAPDARPAIGKFPLIALSHGTGGSALSLAWLGTALASHGYIVAGVNHPGNNALDAYTSSGFSLWSERARDLSEVIV